MSRVRIPNQQESPSHLQRKAARLTCQCPADGLEPGPAGKRKRVARAEASLADGAAARTSRCLPPLTPAPLGQPVPGPKAAGGSRGSAPLFFIFVAQLRRRQPPGLYTVSQRDTSCATLPDFRRTERSHWCVSVT
ncbi:hypothetical protein NDU88_000445 [Pleurodeles waltl]|uniref:Uncharacterized protein n=1 Tax=Pleurodeles waltl TaxID=8319 RepID=A0AAV7KXV8_PLEWA|nr:hypothetical protein NDU88_000445 [Pleurodeles waltl]